MRILVQRVAHSFVEVAATRVGEIGRGMLLLVGVERDDDESTIRRAAEKVAHFRIFEDAAGKMNLSALDSAAEVLVVSQFTLAANTAKGRRPSFDTAMPAARAEPLVEQLVREIRRLGLEVSTGSFGASMQVHLVNDGPVTFLLEM